MEESAKEVTKWILVEWVSENKYTVISRSSLVNYNDKIKPDEDLIGCTIPAIFSKKTYLAKVLQCSNSKGDLNFELSELITQTKAKKPKLSKQSEATADEINDVLGTYERSISSAASGEDGEAGGEIDESQIPAQHRDDLASEKERLEKENEDLKRKLEVAEEKIKILKAKVRELEQPRSAPPSTVDIGSGVKVPKIQMDNINASAGDPPKFARELIRAVFSPGELAGRSLFGNTSNANPKQGPKPPIDSTKRDAVLSYVYNKFGCSSLTDTGHKLMRRAIQSSLTDMLRKL